MGFEIPRGYEVVEEHLCEKWNEWFQVFIIWTIINLRDILWPMEFRVTIYKVDTPALSTLVFLNEGKCSQVCVETFI